MDKGERAAILRQRLSQRLTERGISRSKLADLCRVDRSTLSQILTSEDPRMPSAHLVAEAATHLGVSVDWLLGLSERPEKAAELLSTSMTMPEASRTSEDRQILAWHLEATGQKIRHVPATLPDILKTDDVLAFEYDVHIGKTAAQAGSAVAAQRDWLQQPGADLEICVPSDMLTSLALGEGYWRDLTPAVRTSQIAHMRAMTDRLFPTLRVHAYDTKRVFSAPLTVFGPLLAAVYLGRVYLVFRESVQVQAVTRHFENLVREAEVDARQLPDWLGGL